MILEVAGNTRHGSCQFGCLLTRIRKTSGAIFDFSANTYLLEA